MVKKVSSIAKIKSNAANLKNRADTKNYRKKKRTYMIIIWGTLPLLFIILTIVGVILLAGQGVTAVIDYIAIAVAFIFSCLSVGVIYGGIKKNCAISATIASLIHYGVFLLYARPGYPIVKEFFESTYSLEVEGGLIGMVLNTIFVLPFLLFIIFALGCIELFWFAAATDYSEDYPFTALGGTAVYVIAIAAGYFVLNMIFG